jgi:methionine-rich copper-binding protein CopC
MRTNEGPAWFSVPALACFLLSVAVGVETGYAQHQGHGGPQFGVSAASAGIIAETTPLNDSVLGIAPDQVQLSFGQPVQLVKLVLYTNERDWVDIDFRFNPRANTVFSWPVPELDQLPYYSVAWAILDERDRLVKGSFNFSFGPDAEAPSAVMMRDMMMADDHADHDMQDSLRVMPGDIRFNDQNPNFEPPFAPVLDQPN